MQTMLSRWPTHIMEYLRLLYRTNTEIRDYPESHIKSVRTFLFTELKVRRTEDY